MEERNEYTANELAVALPVWGNECYGRFMQLNEGWLKKYKPNYERAKVLNSSEAKTFEPRMGGIEWLLEKSSLAGLLDRVCRFLMVRKIQHNPKTNWQAADIRCSDTALVFLPRPKRDFVFQKALQKLTNLA